GSVLNSHAYDYNAGNQRTKQTRTAGDYVDYTYDTIGQLQSATGKETGGGTTRLQEKLGYAYDAAANLQYRTNNALLQTFTVDPLNELTNVTRSGTLTVAGTTSSNATSVTVNSTNATRYGDYTFAKDGFTITNGNNSFTAVASDGLGRTDSSTVSVNLPDPVTLAYDLNGNLVSDGRRAFDYDDENQLIRITVTNAWKTEFVYDGRMRRRVRKEFTWVNSAWAQAAEVRYVYDGMLVIQERDANNLPQVSYTRGRDLSGNLQGAGGIGGLLAFTRHSTVVPDHAYYHADGNGNITALVNDKQTVVARYLFGPYGNLLASLGPLADANLYRFSSKEFHGASGLHYYGFRFYEPSLQRWVNSDPLGERGGINLHGFVGNNPISRLDPYGLMDFHWYNPISWYWPGYGGPTYLPPLPLPQPDYSNAGLLRQYGAGIENDFGGQTGAQVATDVGLAVPKGFLAAATILPLGGEEGAYAAADEALQAARAAKAAARCRAAEARAAQKLKNILTKNCKPGPKGDISGAVSDMVGNPVPKPSGGTWDHVQDLLGSLRGLENNVTALQDATDPAIVAVRQQAEAAIEEIRQAIQGAGL
ncbi:MAG: hypothetical protein HY040_27645, partial [Planctomycetes bacterium]|nr:hypothetical protein [Planctomycetota bacterium]